MTAPRVYPLPVLPDGRKAQITSAFRTSARPNHDGCDLFYRWQPSDGMVKLGDGGATRDPQLVGKPRWFIPAGLCAIAAQAGVVQLAGSSPTGYRVWVDHGDGWRTGYFHLRDVRVLVGQRVELGDELGEVGDNPADVDAEHLHFEVSPVDRYEPMDPAVWLRGATWTRARPAVAAAIAAAVFAAFLIWRKRRGGVAV